MNSKGYFNKYVSKNIKFKSFGKYSEAEGQFFLMDNHQTAWEKCLERHNFFYG